MARTVGDLALFLDALSGHCPHDPRRSTRRMFFPARRSPGRRRRAMSPSPPTTMAAWRSTTTFARSARRWRGASRSWAASSRKPRRISAPARRVPQPAQPGFRRRSRAAAWRSIATRSSPTSSGTPSAVSPRRRRRSPGRTRTRRLLSPHRRVLPNLRPVGDAGSPTAAFDVMLRYPETIAGKPESTGDQPYGLRPTLGDHAGRQAARASCPGKMNSASIDHGGPDRVSLGRQPASRPQRPPSSRCRPAIAMSGNAPASTSIRGEGLGARRTKARLSFVGRAPGGGRRRHAPIRQRTPTHARHRADQLRGLSIEDWRHFGILTTPG